MKNIYWEEEGGYIIFWVMDNSICEMTIYKFGRFLVYYFLTFCIVYTTNSLWVATSFIVIAIVNVFFISKFLF